MPGNPATLGDLVEQQLDVFCWCNRCGHSAILATAHLVTRMGPAMAVPRVASKLHCSGCGARDVSTRPAWKAGEVVSRHG